MLEGLGGRQESKTLCRRGCFITGIANVGCTDFYKLLSIIALIYSEID
jgi:hypothetical protein